MTHKKASKKKVYTLTVGNILTVKDGAFFNIIEIKNQTKKPTRGIIRLETNEQLLIMEKSVFKNNGLRFYRLKLFSIKHGLFIASHGVKDEMLAKFAICAKA
jgi:hypothetical protein